MLANPIAKLGAIASAAALALLTALPAHAVSAGSIGVAGAWTSATAEEPSPPAVLLSFQNLFAVVPGTGILSGYDPLSIGDLPLNRASVIQDDAAATIAHYTIDTTAFDGLAWKVYENSAGDQIVFNLDTDATWNRFFDKADTDTSWSQAANGAGLLEYTGSYILPDGSTFQGTGVLNASASGDARIFETTQQVQAIPLPAPAFLLMAAVSGFCYLGRRKRRGRAEAVLA